MHRPMPVIECSQHWKVLVVMPVVAVAVAVVARCPSYLLQQLCSLCTSSGITADTILQRPNQPLHQLVPFRSQTTAKGGDNRIERSISLPPVLGASSERTAGGGRERKNPPSAKVFGLRHREYGGKPSPRLIYRESSTESIDHQDSHESSQTDSDEQPAKSGARNQYELVSTAFAIGAKRTIAVIRSSLLLRPTDLSFFRSLFALLALSLACSSVVCSSLTSVVPHYLYLYLYHHYHIHTNG